MRVCRVQSSQRGSFLSTVHASALANVLKRPIILYASINDLQRLGTGSWGCAGCFPPLRHLEEPKEHGNDPYCGCWPHPVVIGWQDDLHAHYVPLVWAAGSHPVWPLPADIAAMENKSDSTKYSRQSIIVDLTPVCHKKAQAQKSKSFYAGGGKNGTAIVGSSSIRTSSFELNDPFDLGQLAHWTPHMKR